jgi:hypothetical protein
MIKIGDGQCLLSEGRFEDKNNKGFKFELESNSKINKKKKGILNLNKQLIRSCGGGLKLCMTSLGQDLMSELDLSALDHMTNSYHESLKLASTDPEVQDNIAFNEIMNY